MQSINEQIRALYKQGLTKTEIYNQVRPISTATDRNLKEKIHKVIKKYIQILKENDIHDDSAEQTGHFVKGRSKLINKRTGEQVLEWVKTDIKQEDMLLKVKESLSSLLDDLKKQKITVPEPSYAPNSIEDMLALYPVPDAHLGMLANQEETNHDSSLEIMEQRFYTAFEHLIQTAPPAETALLADLGDFIHASDDLNRTRSGHPLDTDTRHWKVVDVGFRMMYKAVLMLLKKHKKVVIESVGGNHSPNTSYYLLLYLDALFALEDRVTVNVSPKVIKYYLHNDVLLAFNHGEKTKASDLIETVIHDNKHRMNGINFIYIHTGHIHHDVVKETKLATIEAHNNLNTLDAWAFGSNYRNMLPYTSKCIMYAKNKGDVGRVMFNNHMG